MNGKYLHLNGFVQFSKSSINIYNRSYSPNPIIEPKEGIPINNLSLTNKTKIILDSLKCPICLNLLWNPVEIENCGHVFCQYCINKTRIINCPLCRGKVKTRPCKTLIKFLGEFQ